VSYALAFSSGARSAFGRLDVELQEDVLDQLDRAAAAADLLPHRQLALSHVLDLQRDRADGTDYVFLTLRYDPERRTLTVLRLGHHARRRPAD
jgi:hypothetical protein